MFVKFPVEIFERDAFQNFIAQQEFSLGNARALMWVSQLAYQIEDVPALKNVLDAWRFDSIQPFVKKNENATTVTTGLYGVRGDAVILAFAGTDPGVWQTIATDAQIARNDVTDVHCGFEAAFKVASGYVEAAINLVQGERLFVTGHSLGGALAAIAARYAVAKRVTPCAVYTFGMPRIGGDRFCAESSASLGPNTYRLVHGDDIVPRVPMPALGFHHVGRMLQCKAETKFDPAAPLSVIGSDEPRFPSVIDSFAGHVGTILSGHVLGRPGPMGGVLGEAFRLLPPDIRHHLQDWYLDALRPASAKAA
jgi:triacylglycerol lipase